MPNQVLVSAGGTATAGIISYSQSIGEPVVELLTGPDVILTQGFQQPHFKGPSDIPNPSGNGVNVYPNPATDVFYIQVFGDQPRKFNIELINLTGMILNSWKLEFSSAFNYKMPVDATRMRVGIYLVRVVSTDGIINRVFKIEKL